MHRALQRACTNTQTIPLHYSRCTAEVLRVPLFLCGPRFRSITKQYFRKADGILVMYDVTAECSFLAVRNWMSSIQVRGGLGSCAAAAPLLLTSSNSLSGSSIFQCPRKSY